jgi:MFS family permease
MLAIPAPVIRLWLSVFFGYLAFGATLQLLPGWLENRFDSSEGFIGLAVGIAFAATAICRPVAGWLGDSGMGKMVVVTGGGFIVAGALGQLLSTSTWSVLAARLVMGAGEAAVFSGALPWVLRGTPISRRGRAAGWFGMSMWSGLALGPLLTGLQVGGSFPSAWLLVTALGLACLAMAAFAPASPSKRPPAFVWRNLWPGGIGMPALVFGLGAYGYGAISAILVLYLAHGVGGQEFGLAVFAAAFLLVRVLGSHAVDRYGGRRALMVTLFVEISGVASLTLASAPILIFVGVALTGAGCSLLFPAVVSVSLSRVRHGMPGTAIAAATSFWDLGILVAGVSAGALVLTVGYSAAFGSALLAACLALILAATMRSTTVDRTRDTIELGGG